MLPYETKIRPSVILSLQLQDQRHQHHRPEIRHHSQTTRTPSISKTETGKPKTTKQSRAHRARDARAKTGTSRTTTHDRRKRWMRRGELKREESSSLPPSPLHLQADQEETRDERRGPESRQNKT
ncbi:hypothetical protein EUGRSUZ_L01390 [Eucalyptus grandis]|uniref:Uncharacterized protein n=1 Tax=Eucalyptus grandis TaxID=71139 RepID=A0A058ZUH7_EUCGR|nr:hypothetical protein EUGRSUZ_L01390 [Eucalyptus grandis]